MDRNYETFIKPLLNLYFEKAWCSQFLLTSSKLHPGLLKQLGGVSRDSYIFWILFRLGITVPSSIIVGNV